jgi:hypothetical protein
MIVEDPSEAFSDMRDKNDLRRLIKDDLLKDAEAPVPYATIEKLRKKHKLTKVGYMWILKIRCLTCICSVK